MTKRGLPLFTSSLLLAASILFSGVSVSANTSGPLLPITDGTYTQWVPKPSPSHFAAVDETPCNGITDYNRTSVVSERDSYGISLSSVPNGATITQIDIQPCASRNSNGGTNPVMDVFYRTGGVNSADAGSYTLPNMNVAPIELATTSFSGLSITKGDTSTLEVGAVLTSGTRGARVSRIATTLTYTSLTAPTALTGTATTTSQIGLSWTDTSSNEDGFNVEHSTDAVNWAPIATTTANVSSFYDTGLSAGTTYYHRVRAFNSGAYTGYTNVSTTTTIDVPPAAPTGLGVATQPGVGSTTDVVLGWTDNSSNETGFQIERGTGGAFSQIATTSANAVTYTDAGLADGTYSYRLRAYNSAGTSGYTNTSTTTFPIAAPVAYWKLDGDSTDAIGANNGSDTNVTYSTTTGKISEGAGLDGSTSAIDIGNMLSGPVNASVAAWIKTSASTSARRIIQQRSREPFVMHGQWIFYLGSDGKLNFFAEGSGDTNGNVVGNTSVDDGNWHLVGVSQNGTTYTFYVDGVADGSVTSGTVVSYDPTLLGSIGYDRRDAILFPANSEYLNGSIDAVGVWNTTLMSADFVTLYNAGAGLQYPF
jgi:hypothetical protein